MQRKRVPPGFSCASTFWRTALWSPGSRIFGSTARSTLQSANQNMRLIERPKFRLYTLSKLVSPGSVPFSPRVRYAQTWNWEECTTQSAIKGRTCYVVQFSEPKLCTIGFATTNIWLSPQARPREFAKSALIHSSNEF